jgi:hypothetical protein
MCVACRRGLAFGVCAHLGADGLRPRAAVRLHGREPGPGPAEEPMCLAEVLTVEHWHPERCGFTRADWSRLRLNLWSSRNVIVSAAAGLLRCLKRYIAREASLPRVSGLARPGQPGPESLA